MSNDDWTTPQEISDVEIAFPAHVLNRMPEWDEIPPEFKRHRGTRWNELMARWFYDGLKGHEFCAKEGVDKDAALRHLMAILGSYEPKHEHKEAAVAYLMSLWFTKVTVGNEVYE